MWTAQCFWHCNSVLYTATSMEVRVCKIFCAADQAWALTYEWQPCGIVSNQRSRVAPELLRRSRLGWPDFQTYQLGRPCSSQWVVTVAPAFPRRSPEHRMPADTKSVYPSVCFAVKIQLAITLSSMTYRWQILRFTANGVRLGNSYAYRGVFRLLSLTIPRTQVT